MAESHIPLIDTSTHFHPWNPEDPTSEKIPEGEDSRTVRLWNELRELVREDHQGLGKGHSADRAMYALSELDDKDVRAIARHCLNAWRCELDNEDARRYFEAQAE